jgi:uncharacterized lipoprotein YajG
MSRKNGFGRRAGMALVCVAALTTLSLTGCATAPTASQSDAQRALPRMAAGQEMVCKYERPIGSRVKQHICLTHQEAQLRDLQAQLLYRNSLVPLHEGTP